MSSLVTAPRRPVPSTSFGSMPSLAAVKRAPGGSSSPVSDFAAGLAASALAVSLLGWTGLVSASCFFASSLAVPDSALASPDAAAPASTIARTCSLVPVAPVSNLISLGTPSTGEGTSSTTLSVSRSTRFSSRLTASPAFLCQLAMVASETDSGRTGTLTSVAMRASCRKYGVEKGCRNLFRADLAGDRVNQRIGDQCVLLLHVLGQVAGGGRGRACAAGI